MKDQEVESVRSSGTEFILEQQQCDSDVDLSWTYIGWFLTRILCDSAAKLYRLKLPSRARSSFSRPISVIDCNIFFTYFYPFALSWNNFTSSYPILSRPHKFIAKQNTYLSFPSTEFQTFWTAKYQGSMDAMSFGNDDGKIIWYPHVAIMRKINPHSWEEKTSETTRKKRAQRLNWR